MNGMFYCRTGNISMGWISCTVFTQSCCFPPFIKERDVLWGYIMYCVNPWDMDIWVFLFTQSCYYTPGGVWSIIRVFWEPLPVLGYSFPLTTFLSLLKVFGVWWFLTRPRGFCIWDFSLESGICFLGSVAFAFGCCCRHEDRGGVLDIVGHVTLPAPHAPIYASIPSPV